MKYLKWDRLQLSPVIDGGYRVSKQSVHFHLFRTFRKKMTWNPLAFNNMTLFYGDKHEEFETLIKNMVKQGKRFSDSIEIALFDRTMTLEGLAAPLEDTNPFFTYHPYGDTLFRLLGDLLTFRQSVKMRAEKRGMAEPPNRKLLFVLLPLEDSDLEVLEKDATARAAYKSLLTDSARERIFIVTLAAHANKFPESLQKELQWVAYLGNENAAHCHSLHSDMEESYYSLRQEVIGLLYSTELYRMTIIHPLAFTPSEWLIAKEAQYAEEDEIYRRFLDTLEDGTTRTKD